MIEYGNAPLDLGLVDLATDEMMFYLYLPVKMAGGESVMLPMRLFPYAGLLARTMEDARTELGESEMLQRHVYLTAETIWVEPGSPGNRPGWHADGYGSDGDLNYIWADMNPTEFAIQDFVAIPDDDIASMAVITEQVDPQKITTYPDRHLLRLDESVVHRVSPDPSSGVRTFVKVSVSRHRYNLRGNSHNHLFEYTWPLSDRGEIRNLDNKDFVK